MFADGQARVTSDAKAVAAALAHPETPLRRVVGSSGVFELNPAGLPRVPDAPKRRVQKAVTAPNPEPSPVAADRTRLDNAEAKLSELDERRKAEEHELRQRQDALDLEIRHAQETYAEARKRASAVVEDARQAYVKAGGKL